MLRPFAQGFLLSLSLCLDLGLVNVAILRTGLEQGTRAAALVGVGSTLGDFVYFTLAAFGAAAVVSLPAVRWTLWLGGTALLLYLAFKMAREVVQPHRIDLARGATPGGSPLGFGFKLAIASPTGILWFAAVGGSVVASFGEQRTELIPFALGFGTAGMLWAVVLAAAAGSIGRAAGPRLVRALSAVAALLFLGLATSIFLGGARDLLRHSN